MQRLAVAGIGKSYDGAGKSTLMKILSGATKPDAGTLRIDDKEVVLEDPREAIDRGIATVHQELSLLPHLSVAENILLGKAPRGRFRWQVDWPEMYRLADEALRELGIQTIDVRQKVSALSAPSTGA